MFQKELLSSIETWKKIEEEQEQKQHDETIKKEEIKNEDPEVEYKRRLIERFSYKNTENIKRIYKENRVCVLMFYSSKFPTINELSSPYFVKQLLL